MTPNEISNRRTEVGDCILLSGDIRQHGIGVTETREGLEFEAMRGGDCVAMHQPVLAHPEAGVSAHCLRDLTPSGFASRLVEIADSRALHFHLQERAIPSEPVKGDP